MSILGKEIVINTVDICPLIQVDSYVSETPHTLISDN